MLFIEANVAVSLANYGLSADFVTRLPDNDIGRAALATLRKYNVGTTHILLAIGVKKLYDQGMSGCIVSANSRGDISPLFLKDFEDNNRKIPPRLVDIHSDIAQLIFQNLFFITEEDYQQAGKYLRQPEHYDFHKILNW